MAFRSAQQARVYIFDLAAAAYARSASASASVDTIDITTIADGSKAFIPGLSTATFNIAGPLDVDENAANITENMKTLTASNPATITYLPLGSDGAAWLVEGHQTQFDTSTSHSGSVDYTVAAQTTGTTDTNGVILEDATTVTVDTDGTAVDNAAATSNGAVFHLHVTAFSGLTSDVITVEGSATGSFGGEETTVATFSTVNAAFNTAGGADRVEVTGTVPRHLRVVDDVTGTGSITRFVAVSRR